MLITRNGKKVSTQCLRLSLRVSVGSYRSSFFFLHFMTTSIFNNGLTLILLLFLLKQQILI